MKTFFKKSTFVKPVMLGLAISASIVSCKKDDDTAPIVTPVTPTTAYTIPTTYNFAGADTLASKQRIAMLGDMLTYIRTTHSASAAPILDAQILKDMYVNVNNKFTGAGLNASGIQLKNQTSDAFGLQAALEASFDDAVIASTQAATTPTVSSASNGVAGKLINGTRYILVDASGFEYKEYLEKGIMGGVFYYQATTLLNSINTFDNTIVTNGTTAQERAWDQAFAYFGVPTDFPTNTTGLKNWGSYCNAVSNALAGNTTNGPTAINTIIMNAWLKGRAAISNKDDVGRDEATTVVVQTWEKVGAARFITYVKGAKANINNQATYIHNLSEGVGFIRAFKYNSAKTISDADIALLLGYFETSGSVNLYTLTTTNLDNAINKMAFLFNLDASLL
jgi:Domain of unknown function (DUF4856)